MRGLETTATYIAESDEFEIDSPTLTATKVRRLSCSSVRPNPAFSHETYAVVARHLGKDGESLHADCPVDH